MRIRVCDEPRIPSSVDNQPTGHPPRMHVERETVWISLAMGSNAMADMRAIGQVRGSAGAW